MALERSIGAEPDIDYVKGLRSCTTQEKLVEFISLYREIANDAYGVARNITTEKEWKEFRRGFLSERRKVFAGDEWASKYERIIMPSVMLEVTLIANHFLVPWWIAYERLKDVGRIIEKKGIAHLVQQK